MDDDDQLSNALMQVPVCETNITCIAQATFKLVNKALLVTTSGLNSHSLISPCDLKNRLNSGEFSGFKLIQICRLSAEAWSLNGRTMQTVSGPLVSAGGEAG